MGARSVVFLLLHYLCLLCLLPPSSVFSKTINCESVRHELQTILSVGKKKSLPLTTYLIDNQNPIYDPLMKVCYNGGQGKYQSCCSHQIEQKYVELGNRQMKKLVSFQKLKRELKAKKKSYAKMEIAFRAGVTRYLIDRMGDRLRLHKPALWSTVDPFFGRLLSNYTKPTPEKIVKDFLVNVSPFLYYHNVKQGDPAELVNQKRDCIAKSVSDLGTHLPLKPKETSIRQLSLAKNANQRLKHSISMMLYVLEKLDLLEFPPSCIRAMARFQLCPTCFGRSRQAVCLNLCHNIFQGCHIHWADLEPSWDRLLHASVVLTMDLTERLNLAVVLRNIVDNLVKKMEKNIVPWLRHIDPEIRKRCFVVGQDIKRVGARLIHESSNTYFPNYLSKPLNGASLIKFLSNQKNFFTSLVKQPCSLLPTSECWNGTHFSSRGYTKPVPEFFLSDQLNNPEVHNCTAKQSKMVKSLKRILDNNYSEILESRRRLAVNPPRPRQPTRSSGRFIEGSGTDSLPEGSGSKKEPPDDDEESGDRPVLPRKSLTPVSTIPRIEIPVKRPRARGMSPPPPLIDANEPSYSVKIVTPTPEHSKHNTAIFSIPSFYLYFFALITSCLLAQKQFVGAETFD